MVKMNANRIRQNMCTFSGYAPFQNHKTPQKVERKKIFILFRQHKTWTSFDGTGRDLKSTYRSAGEEVFEDNTTCM